ncbi:hypothetical protein [Nocardioides litoris]|uniref:hypothetical protein n=1 Tax=Nocardioides litoris TaxID=1926648 RepID=UPI00111EE1FB|nr:hypothetical protein [Nocardioides litoris]
MSPDPRAFDDVRRALDDAAGLPPDEALPHLRAAAESLAGLIDESLAEAVVHRGSSLRAAGQKAGLSENAVGPRLARTSVLGAYAKDGRVTAAGVERARYDAETGTPPPPASPAPPMRFQARRPTKGSR